MLNGRDKERHQQHRYEGEGQLFEPLHCGDLNPIILRIDIEGFARRDIVVAHRDRSRVIRARLSGAHKLGVTMRIHQW